MLLTTEVKIRWGNNRKIYEPLGYKFTATGDYFTVKIEDVPDGSSVSVSYSCDYCNKPYNIVYSVYVKKKKNGIINKDCCIHCQPLKLKESSLLQFGCTNHGNKHIDINVIKQEFIDRNYIPMFEEYINNKTLLSYICNKHGEKGIQKISYLNFHHNGRGCKYCGREATILSLYKYNIEDITEEFNQKQYTIKSKEFKSLSSPLNYICDKHTDVGEQLVTYYCFKTYQHNCSECKLEAYNGENSHSWRGGMSPFSYKLRNYIIPWNEDSRVACSNKCVISGEDAITVHHLYAFHFIVEETLDYFNLKWDTTIEKGKR